MVKIKTLSIETLRTIIGVVFIISAIMKLVSMDSFEIYIYSLNITSLNNSFIISRLVISFEFIIGLLLIFKVYLRSTIFISAISLIGFTIFISYLIINNNNEHCHCFGDSLQMSHRISILKNIILIVLLMIIFPRAILKYKFQKIVFSLIVLTGLITPFIVSTPDSFMIDNYAKQATYNEIALNNFTNNYEYKKGKHIICFFGASCRFCELTARKLEVISENSTHSEIISHVFWGTKNQVEEFYEKNNIPKLDYMTIPGSEFLKITDGKMPLIVLIQDGEIVSKYGYRDLLEVEIMEFLK